MIVTYENREGVAWLKMNRPPVNAINGQLVDELLIQLKTIEADASIKGVILTGLPGYFSAGLDVLELFPLNKEHILDFWERFYELLMMIFTFPKPLFSAISGHCPAGGTVIAIMTDYRMMAEGKFTIGLNEVAVGLVIPYGIGYIAQYLCGQRNAEKLALTAKLIYPNDALKYGLIDEVCPNEEIQFRAQNLMEEWIQLPQMQQRMTKLQFRKPIIDYMNNHRDDDLKQVTDIWFTPEFQVAMGALVTKLSEGR
ncbi:MAG: enoyl-CoA hydratase/isomerase family protein [Candidatus Marinimicrobia bacterium]|nr:enoyl-CoA hydratase/isomerase family protein [Candidatus Neomarinimicrobiota bacterium]